MKVDSTRIVGTIMTNGGTVGIVDHTRTFADTTGAMKVRWGIGRYSFLTEPGVYALGRPDSESPVFVSANYRLSFDILRSSLKGLSCWILVLDTKGINVWCAAGKGTFGTEELINRIVSSNLKEIVSHRKIILPQLGAPGVAAHEVSKKAGFKVIYGPVRAEDIPTFIENGERADWEMRKVKFNLRDRITLAPVEFVGTLKYLLPLFMVAVLLTFFQEREFSILILYRGLKYLGAVAAASFLGPLLLPWIPGKPFALKGALLGLVYAVIFLLPFKPALSSAADALFFTALSSFILMNFTGASTFTSLSGVMKEMKFAVPLQIATGAVALIMQILAIWL